MSVKIKRQFFIWIAFIFSVMIGCLYMMYVLDANTGYLKWLDVCRSVLFLISILGLILYIIEKRKVQMKNGNLLVIFLAIYELIITTYKGTMNVQVFIDIINWPLLLLLSYTFSDQHVKKYSAVIPNRRYKIMVLIVGFLLCIISIPLIQRHLAGFGRIGEVIYGVYFVLTYIPLLVCFYPKNKFVLIVPFITIIFTTKRAAFLSIVLGFILMQFFEYYIMGDLRKKWKKLIKIVIGLLLIYFLITILINQFQLDIIDRLANMNVDEGSGRISIWTTVYDAFKESSLIDKILGHGYGAVRTLHIGGRSINAHNDYLELLYDYGIIGVCLIVAWIIYLFKVFIRLCRRKSVMLPGYALTLTIFVFLTMLSYLLFQSNIMIFLAFYFGIITGIANANNGEVKVF